MKVSKEGQRIARQLMRATLKEGRVDETVVRTVINRLKTDRPRGYLGVAVAYGRLVRLEMERSKAVVESFSALDDATKRSVEDNLQRKYGGGLTINFQVNPDLIGGMRVRVGSDVWDGSVKNRLERLRERFA